MYRQCNVFILSRKNEHVKSYLSLLEFVISYTFSLMKKYQTIDKKSHTPVFRMWLFTLEKDITVEYPYYFLNPHFHFLEFLS